MKTIKRLLLAGVLAGSALGLAGCQSDATTASYNLSKAADYFEVTRRVVFYNGITDTYMLTIEGRCSIEKDNMDAQLEVTCKIGPNAFKKHFLGVSDNVTYFVEQMETADVSVFHHRVVFKPQSIIPDVDLRVDGQDLNKDRY